MSFIGRLFRPGKRTEPDPPEELGIADTAKLESVARDEDVGEIDTAKMPALSAEGTGPMVRDLRRDDVDWEGESEVQELPPADEVVKRD